MLPGAVADDHAGEHRPPTTEQRIRASGRFSILLGALHPGPGAILPTRLPQKSSNLPTPRRIAFAPLDAFRSLWAPCIQGPGRSSLPAFPINKATCPHRVVSHSRLWTLFDPFGRPASRARGDPPYPPSP